MNKVFTDENKTCMVNFTAAQSAVADLHDKYYRSGLTDNLSDVDWVVETDDTILLVEYKNFAAENARNPEAFTEQVSNGKLIEKLRKKYFGGAFYALSLQSSKPISYICVIEADKFDDVLRKRLCAKIKRGLPFELQKFSEVKAVLISDFKVLSIAQWNEQYSMFKMSICE